MKKAKLLTSLSTIVVAGTTVPVVSTSCSDQFNFDGTYTSEQILGLDKYSARNNWIKENFLYEGQPWSIP